MAKTSVTRIINTLDGDGYHDVYEAPQVVSANACKVDVIGQALNAQDNDFTAPTGATQLIIANSTQILHVSASAPKANAWPCAAGQLIVLPVVAGLVYVIASDYPGTCDLIWR